MAASQQKKRSVNSTTQEHCKGKQRKKVDSSDYVLNLSPRIHLAWDKLQKTVVTKREQIGITWADIAPFLESLPQNFKGVADVFSVPKEIFDLNDLMDVLSYEVWATCLSESERKLLTQFLPGGTSKEQTVRSLLTGENHHFGNPSIRWSTSLCSGNLHPNDVLKKEQQIRTAKRQYYSELNTYHKDMLGGLMKWKDKWSRCKDPEKLWSTEVTKHKQGALSICTERTKTSSVPKKEISDKTYIRNSDTAKYMSYIKISKKQHEAIKNLKHSGDGIQTKSLSRVLGDIKGFHVLPFETLVEEEKTRLHGQWLQVVKKDLPVAFEAHQKEKLHRKQLKKCLEQEFSEKRTPVLDKAESDSQESSPREQIEDEGPEYQPDETIIEDVASTPAGFSHYHHATHIQSLNSCQEQRSTVSDQIVAGNFSLSSVNYSPVISQFSGKSDLMECDMEPNASILPPKDIWQAVDSNGKFANDLSQRQSLPTDELRAPMINLERDIMEQEAVESNHASSFSSYATSTQDNLLAPFPQGPQLLSSYAPHEHMNQSKQHGVQFLMANNHISETLQFPHQLQEQQSFIEHSREKALYMHQMMNKNIYSNARYPNREIYSSVNDSFVANNWFPGDLQIRNNYWSGVVPSSSGTTSDGGLFNVLSGCRNVPARSVHDTTGLEQFVEARNLVPSYERVYNFAPRQLKSVSSHEPAAPAPSGLNIPLMNCPPNQNSSTQDSMGKPYLRSWNQ